MALSLTTVPLTPGSGPGTQRHSVKKLINTGQLEWVNNFKDSPKPPLDGVQCNLGHNDMSNKGDLSHNQECNQSPHGLSRKAGNPSWATTVHS